MEKGLTKDDLRQFRLLLLNDIRKILETKNVEDSKNKGELEDFFPGWLKSQKVRKMMDMSPGTLQNLRITGKVGFKKIMGSYYYNKADLQNLFIDEGKRTPLNEFI